MDPKKKEVERIHTHVDVVYKGFNDMHQENLFLHQLVTRLSLSKDTTLDKLVETLVDHETVQKELKASSDRVTEMIPAVLVAYSLADSGLHHMKMGKVKEYQDESTGTDNTKSWWRVWHQ